MFTSRPEVAVTALALLPEEHQRLLDGITVAGIGGGAVGMALARADLGEGPLAFFLETLPQRECVNVLVHEFAHLILGHTGGPSPEQEREAADYTARVALRGVLGSDGEANGRALELAKIARPEPEPDHCRALAKDGLLTFACVFCGTACDAYRPPAPLDLVVPVVCKCATCQWARPARPRLECCGRLADVRWVERRQRLSLTCSDCGATILGSVRLAQPALLQLGGASA